jgi:hypothetical protein
MNGNDEAKEANLDMNFIWTTTMIISPHFSLCHIHIFVQFSPKIHFLSVAFTHFLMFTIPPFFDQKSVHSTSFHVAFPSLP